MICHADCIKEITGILREAFRNRRFLKIIGFNGNKALATTWSNSDICQSKVIKVTLKHAISLIKYCITNSFIRCGDTVVQQLKGLPMGIVPAPLLANIYLFCKERRAMRSGILKITEKLNKVVTLRRYLDDVIALNLDIISIFPLVYGDLPYKVEKVVKTEDSITFDFLDLHVVYSRLNMTFRTSIHDKREGWANFHTIRVGSDSTIHPKLLHGAVNGQILRYYLACNNKSDFIACIKRLIISLTSNLINKKDLLQGLHKFLKKHYSVTRLHLLPDLLRLIIMSTHYRHLP